MKIGITPLWLALACLLGPARASDAAPAFKDSTVTPRYAPERRAHIAHTRIEITPDFATRSIRGQVTHRLVPIVAGTRSILLHSLGLEIRSVRDGSAGCSRFTATTRISMWILPPRPAPRTRWN